MLVALSRRTHTAVHWIAYSHALPPFAVNIIALDSFFEAQLLRASACPTCPSRWCSHANFLPRRFIAAVVPPRSQNKSFCFSSSQPVEKTRKGRVHAAAWTVNVCIVTPARDAHFPSRHSQRRPRHPAFDRWTGRGGWGPNHRPSHENSSYRQCAI